MERINRGLCEAQTRELLQHARVSPLRMTALWLGLRALLSLLSEFGANFVPSPSDMGVGPFYAFLTILTFLLGLALDAGFTLYCMAIRRGERVEYASLFDGFPFAGKVILLTLVQWALIGLWSLLFVIPGLIAYYRYRFAFYNLLENPDIGVFTAIDMSKRQTAGFKGPLFALDLSYLGWAVFAALPDLVYRYNIQSQVRAIVGGSVYWDIQDVLRYINPDVFGAPWAAWQVLMIVWALIVGVCYLARYQCVTLAYFDAAKGVTPEEESPYDLWRNGGGSGHNEE